MGQDFADREIDVVVFTQRQTRKAESILRAKMLQTLILMCIPLALRSMFILRSTV